MDPMDFMFHDSSGPPPAHGNNMPQSSGPWLGHSPAYLPQWASASPMYPHYDASHAAYPPSYAPLPNGPYGPGPPAIARAPAGFTPNQMSAGHWPHGSLPPQPGALPFGFTIQSHASQFGVGPASRPLSIQPPFAQTTGGASAHMESQSLHRGVNQQPQFGSHVHIQPGAEAQFPFAASSTRPMSTHSRQSSLSSQHGQRSASSRHRSSQTHNYSGSALNQNIISDRLGQPSFSDRRRSEHLRGRRSTGSRFSMSETRTESSRPFGSGAVLHPGHRRQVSMRDAGDLEEAEARRVQLLRGSLIKKMVASKAALESLEPVKITDLPASERSCVICYNEYETSSPEGICESPVRLPNCRHIFGNECIRTWLKDSDSCPYCRDKLHSEPKHYPSSSRTFFDMMRARHGLPPESGEEFIRHIISGDELERLVQLHHQYLNREPRPARRPPPVDDGNEDNNEQSRRTRQRRSSSSSVEQGIPSPIHVPAQSRPRHLTTPNSSGQASPTQAAALSTPWIFFRPSSPGSPNRSQHSAAMYQSPAHVVPEGQQPQQGSAPRVRRRAQPRVVAPVVASSGGPAPPMNAMPNPLLSNAQTQTVSLNRITGNGARTANGGRNVSRSGEPSE